MSSFPGFDGFAGGGMDDDEVQFESLHDLEGGDEESVEFKLFVRTKTTAGFTAEEVQDAVAQAIHDSSPSELDIVSVSASFQEDEVEELESAEDGDLCMLWNGEALVYLALPDSADTTKERIDNSLLDIDVQDENDVCHDITLSLED